MIHIADSQTDRILDVIDEDEFWNDVHKKSLKDTLETFDFTTFADREYAEHLAKRNRIIIPDEDGRYIEFIIENTRKYRDTDGSLLMEVYSVSSYLELAKAKTIEPQTLSDQTPNMAIGFALEGTGWLPGRIEGSGTRTFHIDQYTNPYSFTKTIATEYKLERNFRVEHDGNKITGRFLDLVERVGMWRGREVEFGKDLIGIERKEDFSNIVTALIGLGPEREDGTRLEVFVEDKDALARWGRNGQHLIDVYEPESTDQTMTEERLRELTQNELEKRINSIVEYTADIADLEKVPGLEHEKIRFGDTLRIKDTQFNPPLYLEARVHTMERSIKKNGYKTVTLGDYIEYTEEEINAIWNQLRNEIKRRLDRMAIVTINSTAGNVFKNAQGETELTARTFVNGAERDEDGTLYDYQWMRFDKNGNHDTEFYAEGKTITVKASDIDEKATYRVLVAYELEVINTAEITISNVFDGEDGEQGPPGPPGEDGKTFYTWIKYADTPTSGMSDSPEGKEYIGIAYNKETPTPSTNYDDYIWAKFKGEQGIPGPPGEDGQPTYTWVKYADDDKGNGMSDSPEGKKYIGLAFNKTTPQESNNPNDYTWSLMPQNIEIGGRNLLTNSDFSRTYKGNPFTVDGKTYDTYPYQWGGYNSGIDNPTTNYHAHIDDDTFGFNVVEYNETNGQRNWKGISQSGLEKRLSPTQIGKFTFSVDVYATGTGTRLFGGFYYHRKSDGQRGFHSGQFNIQPTEVDKWVRMSAQCRLNDDVDFSKTILFYIYGYNFATNSILYIKNVKLEYGNKETDWTRAEEDVQAEIDEAKQEAEEAKQTAQQAQTTADGKNSVFTQPTAPPTTGRKIGDVWFDTSRDNLMHRFNGIEWVEAKWGEQSIVANSITANHIKSLVGLNVNDQFVVDQDGNVRFSGHLEGASGSFITEGEAPGKQSIFQIHNGIAEMTGPDAHMIISPFYIFMEDVTAIEDDFGVYLDFSGVRLGRNWLDERGFWRRSTYAGMRWMSNDNHYEDGILEILSTMGEQKIIFRAKVLEYPEFSKPLWTGTAYPLDTATIYPSKRLTDCMTGWILRFQRYIAGTGTQDNNFHYIHIPKTHALFKEGAGIRITLGEDTDQTVTKYIYVYNDRIEGHASNNQNRSQNRVLTGVFEY